jgi:putative tricarboxylic transport membrane protein
MRLANIIISVSLLVFSGFYGVLIARLPDRDLPNTLGAAFMPWVLAGFLSFLSLLLLINSFSSEHEDTKVSLPSRDLFGIAGLLALIVIYIALMNYLGFVLVSIVFLAVLTWFAGSRKPLGILIFSITTTIVVYLLFHKFFSVQLPAGIFL